MAKVIPMHRLGAGQVVDTEGETVAEAQPEAAGAPEPQPPARAQLAADLMATAQALRSATAQLVAIAPAGADTARLLGTYNSLLSTLQELHKRLEGATDADLLDIGSDLQGAVKSAQEYLTEAGKVVGSTGAALAPAGGKRRWPTWLLVALVGGVLAGGGYWFWTSRKKRGPKLGRPPKKRADLDD